MAKLIGLWRFDEGEGAIAYDLSEYGNDGTLKPDYPSNAPTWIDQKGILFDGKDDYILCGNNPILNITGPITIIVSIKPTAAGEGGPNAGPICKAQAEESIWSWQLRYNAPGGGNYMGFQFNGDPEGSTWVSVKQNLLPEKRYRIGGVFDGTNIICYLNGLQADINQISSIKSSNAYLFIGQDGWGNIFNGAIYEAKIYEGALNAEEMLVEYEASFVGGISGIVTNKDTGLVISGVKIMVNGYSIITE